MTAARARNVVVGRNLPPDLGQTGSVLGPIAGRQVGDTPVAITRQQEALLADPGTRGESVLGNLIADAQLAATDTEQGAVAAFMNPGGIRADLDAGPITFEEAFTVQPFGNNVVTLDLTGAQLQCLLEQQFTVRRVLQPSAGVPYTVDPAGNTGPEVDAGATYRITVNSFLADGGDGFGVLRSGSNRAVSGLDVDAFAQYLSANRPISAPATDRIRTAGGAPGGS